MHRNYYVKYNAYGTNLTADSIGWEILIFASKKEREAWLSDNRYNGCNRVASEVYAKHINKYLRPRAYEIIDSEYDTALRAVKLSTRWA